MEQHHTELLTLEGRENDIDRLVKDEMLLGEEEWEEAVRFLQTA